MFIIYFFFCFHKTNITHNLLSVRMPFTLDLFDIIYNLRTVVICLCCEIFLHILFPNQNIKKSACLLFIIFYSFYRFTTSPIPCSQQDSLHSHSLINLTIYFSILFQLCILYIFYFPL